MVYIGVASTDHGPVVCERATIAIGKSTFWFRFLSQDGIQLKFNLACDIRRKVGFPREILPHFQGGSWSQTETWDKGGFLWPVLS